MKLDVVSQPQNILLDQDKTIIQNDEGIVLQATIVHTVGIDDIIIKKGTLLGFHSDGQAWHLDLMEDHKIRDHTFHFGTELHFTKSNQLLFAILYQNHILNGKEYKAPCVLQFTNYDEVILDLPAETNSLPHIKELVDQYDGEDLSKEDLAEIINQCMNKAGCGPRAVVLFHPNGLLHLVKTREARLIQDVYYAASLLTFHDNGTLHHAVPDKDQKLNGIPIQAGKMLSFYENGGIESCYLSTDWEVQSIPCSHDFPTTFHPNGALASCYLAREHKIEDRTFPVHSMILFDEDGTWSNWLYHIKKDQAIRGFKLKNRTRVCLGRDGKLKSAQIYEPHSFGDMKYPEFSTIEFDELGKIKQ